MIDIENIKILDKNCEYELLNEIILRRTDNTPYGTEREDYHTTDFILKSKRYEYYAHFVSQKSNNVILYSHSDLGDIGGISTERVISAISQTVAKSETFFNVENTIIYIFDIDDGKRVIYASKYKNTDADGIVNINSIFDVIGLTDSLEREPDEEIEVTD